MIFKPSERVKSPLCRLFRLACIPLCLTRANRWLNCNSMRGEKSWERGWSRGCLTLLIQKFERRATLLEWRDSNRICGIHTSCIPKRVKHISVAVKEFLNNQWPKQSPNQISFRGKRHQSNCDVTVKRYTSFPAILTGSLAKSRIRFIPVRYFTSGEFYHIPKLKLRRYGGFLHG